MTSEEKLSGKRTFFHSSRS